MCSCHAKNQSPRPFPDSICGATLHRACSQSTTWIKAACSRRRQGRNRVRMRLALRTETTNLPLYFSLLCITFLRYILYTTQECNLHLMANTYKKTTRINELLLLTALSIIIVTILNNAFPVIMSIFQLDRHQPGEERLVTLLLFDVVDLPSAKYIFFYFSMLPVFLLNPWQHVSKPSSFILPPSAILPSLSDPVLFRYFLTTRIFSGV